MNSIVAKYKSLGEYCSYKQNHLTLKKMLPETGTSGAYAMKPFISINHDIL